MTDIADTRRRTEDAAFDAMQRVWNSHFWLTMAYKNGTPNNLARARALLAEAINAIDAAQPAPAQEAAE